jgi:hypothetical protein
MAGRCPGHPRLSCLEPDKTWMPGTRPGMTSKGSGCCRLAVASLDAFMFSLSPRWAQVVSPDREPSSGFVWFQFSRRPSSIPDPRELQPSPFGQAARRAVLRRLAGRRFACLSCSLRTRRGEPHARIPNHSTIVRGLIGFRLLVSVYEGTRISCTEHTEASGRSRALAGGAGRRCWDRPDLCQPARTRTGGSGRCGTRKTRARPLLKY